MSIKQSLNSPKKILIVLTSHDQLGDTGNKTGFWLEEFATPYYVFKDAGVEITLASIKGGQPPIDPTSQQPEWLSESTKRMQSDQVLLDALASTLSIEQLDADQYDAVFFPGGHGPMWDFPDNAQLSQLIETFHRKGKVISAVCHGVVALVDPKLDDGTPLITGKKLSCFSNGEEAAVQLTDVVPFLLEEKLSQTGGIVNNGTDFEPNIVVDGKLITGQNPASSGPCAAQVLETLKLNKS